MLILTRRVGESLCIYPKEKENEPNEIIEIFAFKIKGNQVSLGIKASDKIVVHRKEIYEKIFGVLKND